MPCGALKDVSLLVEAWLEHEASGTRLALKVADRPADGVWERCDPGLWYRGEWREDWEQMRDRVRRGPEETGVARRRGKADRGPSGRV